MWFDSSTSKVVSLPLLVFFISIQPRGQSVFPC